MRMHFIKILPGDKVLGTLPYDLTRAGLYSGQSERQARFSDNVR